MHFKNARNASVYAVFRAFFTQSLAKLRFYYKYQTLKKRRGHKKAVIAIARKMLVAIYHMIRDDADFLPVDHEKTLACHNHETKGLNLDNILTFLGEHGANEETLQLVRSQYQDTEANGNPESRTESLPKNKKQPNSSAKAAVVPKQDAGRKRSMSSKTKLPDSSPSKATA